VRPTKSSVGAKAPAKALKIPERYYLIGPDEHLSGVASVLAEYIPDDERSRGNFKEDPQLQQLAEMKNLMFVLIIAGTQSEETEKHGLAKKKIFHYFKSVALACEAGYEIPAEMLECVGDRKASVAVARVWTPFVSDDELVHKDIRKLTGRHPLPKTFAPEEEMVLTPNEEARLLTVLTREEIYGNSNS
jgi:hypothetical protein